MEKEKRGIPMTGKDIRNVVKKRAKELYKKGIINSKEQFLKICLRDDARCSQETADSILKYFKTLEQNTENLRDASIVLLLAESGMTPKMVSQMKRGDIIPEETMGFSNN